MKHFRPISKSMIEKLKYCRDQELNDSAKYVTMDELNYAVAPLYKRGLIETKKRIVDNKLLECIYLTEAGKEFLKKLDSKE